MWTKAISQPQIIFFCFELALRTQHPINIKLLRDHQQTFMNYSVTVTNTFNNCYGILFQYRNDQTIISKEFVALFSKLMQKFSKNRDHLCGLNSIFH